MDLLIMFSKTMGEKADMPSVCTVDVYALPDPRGGQPRQLLMEVVIDLTEPRAKSGLSEGLGAGVVSSA